MIFKPWNYGLGDNFACINLLLHRGESQQRPQPLSRLQNGTDLGPLHDAILDVLDAPPWIISMPEEGTIPLSGYDVWATPYYPTKRTWDRGRPSDYAVYHFDGESVAAEKNPPPEDQQDILQTLQEYGLEPVRLGKHLGVKGCVEAAAGAALFVGCDSGLSHLAHSVGLPLFLLQYRLPVVTCHRGKSYILCEGAQDFRTKLRCWINYRHFIGMFA